jgi:hypothetical protein
MAVYWEVVPCNLVEIEDISEVLTASVTRVIGCRMSVKLYQTTQSNIPEDIYILASVRT